MNGVDLPQAFLDWWFAPWDYAGRVVSGLPLARDILARRDGYRLWCERERVTPDFPARFEPSWHIACSKEREKLLQSARLFAGLFAAREHDHALLDQLSLADRKWCAGIASLQPLRSARTTESNTQIAVRGLAELATRLECDFPGMWSRLRLLLPDEPAREVDAIIAPGKKSEQESTAALRRVQRCWQMCHARAAAM